MSSTSDKKAEDEAAGPCKVCGGAKSEHADKIHAFTTFEGDLVTHAEKAKREAKPQPLILRQEGQVNGALGRLIEVLVAKDLIQTQEELMYITGLKKEVTVRGTSLGTAHGFRDGDDRKDAASE